MLMHLIGIIRFFLTRQIIYFFMYSSSQKYGSNTRHGGTLVSFLKICSIPPIPVLLAEHLTKVTIKNRNWNIDITDEHIYSNVHLIFFFFLVERESYSFYQLEVYHLDFEVSTDMWYIFEISYYFDLVQKLLWNFRRSFYLRMQNW